MRHAQEQQERDRLNIGETRAPPRTFEEVAYALVWPIAIWLFILTTTTLLMTTVWSMIGVYDPWKHGQVSFIWLIGLGVCALIYKRVLQTPEDQLDRHPEPVGFNPPVPYNPPQ
jgi:hypothetical protein